MNKFEESFFHKYVSEGSEIMGIIHIHFIDIAGRIFLWLSMGALIPSFLYYYSERIRDLIPFYFLEGFLIIIFIKIIYDIFDWYNDVWIVTDSGVTQLNRSLFKTDTTSVEYDKIEGLEVIQDGIIDKALLKGTIIIHKIGDDSFRLENSFKPYKSVDLIEEVSNYEEIEEDIHDNKFDVIMDALGGVVENYLEKHNKIDDKQIKLEQSINEVKNKDGTIDLR